MDNTNDSLILDTSCKGNVIRQTRLRRDGKLEYQESKRLTDVVLKAGATETHWQSCTTDELRVEEQPVPGDRR